MTNAYKPLNGLECYIRFHIGGFGIHVTPDRIVIVAMKRRDMVSHSRGQRFDHGFADRIVDRVQELRHRFRWKILRQGRDLLDRHVRHQMFAGIRADFGQYLPALVLRYAGPDAFPLAEWKRFQQQGDGLFVQPFQEIADSGLGVRFGELRLQAKQQLFDRGGTVTGRNRSLPLRIRGVFGGGSH